jgi:hypothetical protein
MKNKINELETNSRHKYCRPIHTWDRREMQKVLVGEPKGKKLLGKPR